MNAIWHTNPHLEEMGSFRRETMVDHLGIELIEVGPDFLKGRMPVDRRTHQPYGIMHGGASCVLAETLASLAGNYCIDLAKHYCVGVEINTSHIKSVRSGYVIGIAKPLHLGKSTQVWEIPIRDEKENLVSITRLRLAVLDRVIKESTLI